MVPQMTQPILTTWNPTVYMRTPMDIIAHLEAACEDGDETVISAVIRDIALATEHKHNAVDH
jgi:DNA-binding phage protein